MWKYISWIKVSSGCMGMCIMCVFVCCAGTAACWRRRWRFTHSTTETPQLGLPLRNGDAQREREREKGMWRECERGSKRKRKRGSMWERGKVERVCVFIFCLFCHKLFKGYVLPATYLGMRVKVEEFLLLFPLKPPNLFCWFLFFLFPFSPLLYLCLSSLFPICTQTLVAVVQLTLPWHQFHYFCVLFSLKHNTALFFIIHMSIIPLI